MKACVSDCVRGRIGHSGQGAPSSVVSQCELSNSWHSLWLCKKPTQCLGVANSTGLLCSWTPWVRSQKRAGKGSSLLCGVWSLGRGVNGEGTVNWRGWTTSNLVSSCIHLAFGMGWLMSPHDLLGMELPGLLNWRLRLKEQVRGL